MGVRVSPTAQGKGSILETPCFLAMQSSPSLTFTLTALATILPSACAISLGLRPFSTLANTYGSVVELVDTLVLLKKSTIFLLFLVNECIFIVNYVYYELQGLY